MIHSLYRVCIITILKGWGVLGFEKYDFIIIFHPTRSDKRIFPGHIFWCELDGNHYVHRKRSTRVAKIFDAIGAVKRGKLKTKGYTIQGSIATLGVRSDYKTVIWHTKLAVWSLWESYGHIDFYVVSFK